jgi:hypothetical protein
MVTFSFVTPPVPAAVKWASCPLVCHFSNAVKVEWRLEATKTAAGTDGITGLRLFNFARHL